MNKKNIALLCKVVDNFGDIGVVYRLAKSLCDKEPDLNLTIICSNLKSFSMMADFIDPEKKLQTVQYKSSTWTVTDWDFPLKELNFRIILECFQCGRPDWLDDILFAKENTSLFQIINIDYLTAEDYADEFHCLKSGTRSSLIKKINFMPGFTDKTGGLIFSDYSLSKLPENLQIQNDCFNISFFSYEQDCDPIVKAIEKFSLHLKQKGRDLHLYLSSGKSFEPFIKAYKTNNATFSVTNLNFLQQDQWDLLLSKMNFNFIRGEDSLSRAALLPSPYLWQAYFQDEDYQLVKINALLDRMKDSFSEQEFHSVKTAWNLYNQKLFLEENRNSKLENSLFELFSMAENKESPLNKSFCNFSKKLLSNGNFSVHLLEYIFSLEF